jgi:PP-loop superfamily ATP-utilizing enzyme
VVIKSNANKEKIMSTDNGNSSAMTPELKAIVLRKQAEAIQYSVDRAKNYLKEYAWPQGGIPDDANLALEEVEGDAERLIDEAKKIEALIKP